MSASVSIIVVNWNGRHHLQLCLTALFAQTYPNFEVILVDNGSTDGSQAFVREQFPTVRLIALPENVGFARGNNEGIRASTADYIATVNNDTRVDPNWLTALVETAESNPNVGMCAAKLLFWDRPDVINSAGICLDRAGIAWDRLGGQPNSAQPASPTPVFGASGGAALYRRSMLNQIGLFDDDFFAYLEDVDLAWRARLAGWDCLYVDTAVILHHHSATAIEGSPFKNKLLGRNKVWAILKNYPWPLLLRYLPAILAYDLGSVLVALLVRRDASPLYGRLQAIPKLPTIWQKRRKIQQSRTISLQKMRALMEPLTTPRQVWQRYQHLGPSPK
ncbi:MAG: glycosyltransferase family 2 protein [Ardenticatenaceae bacterium]|nr:glycosyltransferase family 2 protein [Ardenticatenaceae bacterium]MCB8975059.1 glycosyltransferase family 2 protein [Ardenticatenaceae bacterium]